jgi:hypothetical protein
MGGVARLLQEEKKFYIILLNNLLLRKKKLVPESIMASEAETEVRSISPTVTPMTLTCQY